MAKKKRKNPPSREKYERDNPVVSFRVSRKEYDVLQATKKKEGRSNADIMRAGLGLFEVKIRAEEEIRQQAYEKGQVNGYELAESDFKITYPCSRCKKMIEVTTEEEKKAIRKFMVDNGWHHGDCNNP